MRRKQEGVTAIGMLILAAFIGMFAWAFLQLVPIYLEQMKIASVLEDVKRDLDGTKASVTLIKAAIGKRLNVEMINVVSTKDFRVTKSENGYKVQAKFEQSAPYVANVSLVVAFDKSVEIRR